MRWHSPYAQAYQVRVLYHLLEYVSGRRQLNGLSCPAAAGRNPATDNVPY